MAALGRPPLVSLLYAECGVMSDACNNNVLATRTHAPSTLLQNGSHVAQCLCNYIGNFSVEYRFLRLNR